MKFLPFLLVLSCCASHITEVSKEYAAAIDVGCFLYGLQNTPDAASAKIVAGKCNEGMTKIYLQSRGAK